MALPRYAHGQHSRTAFTQQSTLIKCATGRTVSINTSSVAAEAAGFLREQLRGGLQQHSALSTQHKHLGQ